ncbi:MAG: hypothetical protein ACOC1K_06500 [Nanoarchaeota archaeon]
MAGQTSIDLVANLKINQDEFKNLINNMKKIDTGVKGVGQKRAQKVQSLREEMKKLQSDMSKGLSSGKIFEPGEMEKYRARLDQVNEGFRKTRNEILGANKAYLNMTKNQKKQLETYNKSTKESDERLKAMYENLNKLRVSSEKLKKDTKEFKLDLNIDPKNIDSIEKVNKEIEKREKALSTKGKRTGKEKREIKQLEKLREYYKKTGSSVEDLESKQKALNIQIKKERMSREISAAKAKDLYLKLIKDSQDLTKEEKDKLTELVKQEMTMDKIVSQYKQINTAKQTQEIKKNNKATKEGTKAKEAHRKGLLKTVTAATLYYGALRAVRRIVSSITDTIKNLDKSLTEVAMVTSKSREEA